MIPHRGWSRPALICVLAVFSLTPLLFAGEPQWVEVRSPHFSVVTDTGEKRGREVALKFEQMRAVFGALLTKLNVNLPVPLQIVAFRSTKELRQFAPLWHGKPTQVAGLFAAGEDRSFILLDMSVEDPWSVVFHEYAHQLMNGNVQGETQPWFDEGFAEYFSSIDVDSKQARLGQKTPPGDLEVLRQYGWLKTADLLRVQHNSQAYNEGDHRSVFYAQSWLIVHYLYDTKQTSKVFVYFDGVFQKKLNIDDAFQQSFGMTPAQFDKTLQKYFNTGQIRYFTIPTPPGIETTGYTVTPVSLPDAKAIMADMHLHSPDYQDKAVQEFEEVLKTQPDNAAALRGMGYACLQKQDFEGAGSYFTKAAERDSKDPRVHYYSALLMNREGALGRDPDKLARMKKELQASIALDPSFADSYALLSFAYMSSGEHSQALESMKKALELSPRNEQYLFNLSLIYLSLRRTDDATAVLRALAGSANPEVAMRARQSLEQAQQMKAAMERGMAIVSSPEEPTIETLPPGNPPTEGGKAAGTEVKTVIVQNTSSPKFLKGKLVSVDCSAAPVAVLNVVFGGKTWKMKVADSNHVIVIGADKFSCSWTNQKVALNYRQTGESEGSVMTVEIQ